MIWLIYALLGAFFTSMTSILSKVGAKNVNSNFLTAYRTFIVIVFCLILCLITGSFNDFNKLNFYNWLFLILSGVMTGCSWLCYYRALKLGSINKVAPIDKSSFILTSVLFLIFFFDDTTKKGNILIIFMIFISMILMLIGTFLMVDNKKENENKSNKWLIYAILSSIFASFVSLFIKIGLNGISTNLGTFIRTIIVFVFASVIVLVKKDYQGVSKLTFFDWIFLTLSGLSTGGAWLFEYYALNSEGVNLVAVNSINKVYFAYNVIFLFHFKREIYKAFFNRTIFIEFRDSGNNYF